MNRIPYPLTAMLATVMLLTACSGGSAKDDAKEEAAVPVEVAHVGVGPIDAAWRGTATLEAEDEAVVVAKTAGIVEQVLVEQGDTVAAGQVLARLETERLRLEVDRARANLDKLQSEFVRNESVYRRNLISREAFERAKFELDAARAAYDLVKLTLTESEIRAPIEGVVSQRDIKIGNTVAVHAPLFRITKLNRLEAQLHVPERDLHKLKNDQPAVIAVDAWPDRLFQGRVLRVSPVVDAASGTVRVTVAMDPDQSELKPGMFGRVEILYDRRDSVVLLPRDAVITEDAQQWVYVIENGKALRRAVRTGYANAEHFEVMDGVIEGEQVVVTGQNALRDNARVLTVNEPAALADSNGEDQG
jgi:membrane fusion protein, multidrug efflux system